MNPDRWCAPVCRICPNGSEGSPSPGLESDAPGHSAFTMLPGLEGECRGQSEHACDCRRSSAAGNRYIRRRDGPERKATDAGSRRSMGRKYDDAASKTCRVCEQGDLGSRRSSRYERTYSERAIARGVDTALQIDFNDVYVTPPKLSDRRAGLIVDPEDGRLPPTVPAASTRSSDGLTMILSR